MYAPGKNQNIPEIGRKYNKIQIIHNKIPKRISKIHPKNPKKKPQNPKKIPIIPIIEKKSKTS